MIGQKLGKQLVVNREGEPLGKALARGNEIGYPRGSIVEPVASDDVCFSGLVVPFRLLIVTRGDLSDVVIALGLG
jgi:hypothetical protein